MYRAFNCGIGMIIAIAPEDKDTAITTLSKHDIHAFEIGHIAEGNSAEPVIIQ